jgi:hypothetical protein
MGNCADSCRDSKTEGEVLDNSKKREAGYMVGGTNKNGFDVKAIHSGYIRRSGSSTDYPSRFEASEAAVANSCR